MVRRTISRASIIKLGRPTSSGSVFDLEFEHPMLSQAIRSDLVREVLFQVDAEISDNSLRCFDECPPSLIS